MEIIIVLGIGILIGCVLMAVVNRIRAAGALRVDTSDPDDGPYLFLELERDVNELRRKKYVTLKVDTKSYVSHE